MRQYTVEETMQRSREKKLEKIICNQCGEVISLEAEAFSIAYKWGYGSKFDLEKHEFDLCESCYEKLIVGFKIPTEVEEYQP